MTNYHKYRVKGAPASVFYIPNFLTPLEETNLTQHIYSSPKPKWTQLSHRRLQNWGGIPHPKGMIPEKIPAWLQQYVDRVNSLNVFDETGCVRANHVLINEYLPGQGILAHLDGPLFYPTIVTVNCGSHAVLVFRESVESGGAEKCRILLEPRSVLILKDDMYHKYLHQIDEIHDDVIDERFVNLENCTGVYKIGDTLTRDTRISLTIRHVPKTAKIKLIL